jgi:hypothetical protein
MEAQDPVVEEVPVPSALGLCPVQGFSSPSARISANSFSPHGIPAGSGLAILRRFPGGAEVALALVQSQPEANGPLFPGTAGWDWDLGPPQPQDLGPT